MPNDRNLLQVGLRQLRANVRIGFLRRIGPLATELRYLLSSERDMFPLSRSLPAAPRPQGTECGGERSGRGGARIGRSWCHDDGSDGFTRISAASTRGPTVNKTYLRNRALAPH